MTHPTVPVATNGLEGWSSCCGAAVTYSVALGDPVLVCKACYAEVEAVRLDGERGDKLGEIVAAVMDGGMTADAGAKAQGDLLS